MLEEKTDSNFELFISGILLLEDSILEAKLFGPPPSLFKIVGGLATIFLRAETVARGIGSLFIAVIGLSLYSRDFLTDSKAPEEEVLRSLITLNLLEAFSSDTLANFSTLPTISSSCIWISSHTLRKCLFDF